MNLDLIANAEENSSSFSLAGGGVNPQVALPMADCCLTCQADTELVMLASDVFTDLADPIESQIAAGNTSSDQSFPAKKSQPCDIYFVRFDRNLFWIRRAVR